MWISAPSVMPRWNDGQRYINATSNAPMTLSSRPHEGPRNRNHDLSGAGRERRRLSVVTVGRNEKAAHHFNRFVSIYS